MSRHPATWAWAIATPVAAISGNPVWWPYWILTVIAWVCCAHDVCEWWRNSRATDGVQGGSRDEPATGNGGQA